MDPQDEKLVQKIKDMLNKGKEDFSSIVTEIANSKGYVGDVDVTPMFSLDAENIRSIRKDLEEKLTNIKVTIEGIDNLPDKIDALNKLKDDLEKNGNSLFGSADNDIAQYEYLLDLKNQGYILTQQEEDDLSLLADSLKDILRLRSEINNLQGQSRDDLEAEANDLLVQVLIKRNEEKKKLNEINKELSYRNKKEEEGVTLQERFNHRLDAYVLNTKKFANGFNEVKTSMMGMFDIARKLLEPWGKLDQASANYARNIGLGAERYRQLRRDSIIASQERHIAERTGFSAEEQIEAMGMYTSNIGRQVSFNPDQQEDMAYGMKLLGEQNAQAFMQGLENFGLSSDAAIDRANELFKRSEKAGVAFSKYSKTFLENIKLAQNYTFRNGLNGLSDMAKRSAEIKMNLAEVSKFVDKTSTLEGSLQSAASLSVLGGNFALGANPLNMLYNGLNDFEGAEKQMENILKGLVSFNQETKQLEMSAFNRERMKAAAQAMGVDYNSMMETAFSLGREEQVAPIINRLGYQKGSDEYQTILNKSYLDKEGNAKVNINGQAKSVSNLTSEDINTLTRTDFNDSDNIRTITGTLLGWDDIIMGTKKGIDEQRAYRAEVTGIGERAKNLIELARDNSHLISDIASAVEVIKMGILALGVGNGFGNMGRSFGGRPGIPNLNTFPQKANNKFLSGASAADQRNFYNSTYQNLRQQNYSHEMANRMATQQVVAAGGNPTVAAANVGRQKVMTNLKRGFTPSMASMGTGMAIGAIGGFGGQMLSNSGQEDLMSDDLDRQKTGVTKSTWGGALSGAAQGAMYGSFLGWYGMAAGALIGGLIGGVSSHNSAEKQRLVSLISRNSGHALRGDYSISELEAIMGGKSAIYNYPGLPDKIRRNEGINDSGLSIFDPHPRRKEGGLIKPKKMSIGGILHGEGTGTSDSNLAWLSNNEYIMPANRVSNPNNKKILDSMRNGDTLIPQFKEGGLIKPIGNQMNVMKVNDYGNNSNTSYNSLNGASNIGLQSVKIEPLTINGTIKLDLGGYIKDIDGKELLNNPMFIKNITDMIAKNLNRQTHYGYEKNEFYKKF